MMTKQWDLGFYEVEWSDGSTAVIADTEVLGTGCVVIGRGKMMTFGRDKKDVLHEWLGFAGQHGITLNRLVHALSNKPEVRKWRLDRIRETWQGETDIDEQEYRKEFILHLPYEFQRAGYELAAEELDEIIEALFDYGLVGETPLSDVSPTGRPYTRITTQYRDLEPGTLVVANVTRMDV